ncbi:hypothetical protein FAGAP_11597 [Fusarium agapanthi]|uniref:BTB domain-containing protein n=1 Tax=Fusarium agapanthi TaxID=1803897 RepID=A0A9P5AYV9_9HYPO|nr:hypothetical protein FAGAP_11597 [Fusarium agapanthi]
MKPSPFTFDPRADTLIILQNPNAHLQEENEVQVDSEPEYERLGSDEAGLMETTKARRDSPMTLDNDQSYPRGYLEEGGSTQVEFRVSSRHLSLVSPVFRAMLESQFKESRPNDQGLYELQASEWDAEALVILLDIIHGHHREVPKRISVETLSHIAIIVDYYGCHEIMELVFAAWVSYLGPPEEFVKQDSMRWLFISWVFRQEALFTTATKMLLLYDNGKYVVDLPIPQPILGNDAPDHFIIDDTDKPQIKLMTTDNSFSTLSSAISTISNKISSKAKPAAQKHAPVCFSAH